MKYLLIALLTLCAFVGVQSNQAQASGKITLQNNFFDEGREYRPTVGFQIYEKLTRGSAFNFWTGYGAQPLEALNYDDNTNWYVAKGQLDLYFGRFTISPGVQYKKIIDDSFDDTHGFLKIDYKIW